MSNLVRLVDQAELDAARESADAATYVAIVRQNSKRPRLEDRTDQPRQDEPGSEDAPPDEP